MQTDRPEVENFQNVARVVVAHTNHGRDGGGLGGTNQVRRRIARKSRVLAVNDDVVETRQPQALDNFGRGHLDKAPEQETILLEARFRTNAMHSDE